MTRATHCIWLCLLNLSFPSLPPPRSTFGLWEKPACLSNGMSSILTWHLCIHSSMPQVYCQVWSELGAPSFLFEFLSFLGFRDIGISWFSSFLTALSPLRIPLPLPWTSSDLHLLPQRPQPVLALNTTRMLVRAAHPSLGCPRSARYHPAASTCSRQVSLPRSSSRILLISTHSPLPILLYLFSKPFSLPDTHYINLLY